MTDKEKVEEYYEDNECYSYLSEIKDFEEVFDIVEDRVKKAYIAGIEEGRKEKNTIMGAMKMIKKYCIKIIDENGDCKKCIFCSKGYNGCKLQTAPINWELAE